MAKRKRNQPEKAIQAQIVRLLRSLGADVWVLGTRRRKGDYQGTMQTPGIPDLYVMLPDHWDQDWSADLWIEVKAPCGRMNEAQKHFMVMCEQHRINHIVGGLDEVMAWLIENGYLLRGQISHERRAAS